MHLFPESIFEVRTKKCKKTVKRNRTTGKCQPFTTRNVLHFHARKKKTKDWFYHVRSHFAWIWTLTGAFYSEHSFCCFTDYTKLYVCAHRASKTLTARLEAGPALVVSQVSRVGSQQGRTRFHSLLTPRATAPRTYLFSQNVHLSKLQSTECRAEIKRKCALRPGLHFLHSAQPALEQGGVALIACRRCLKSRSEGELW